MKKIKQNCDGSYYRTITVNVNRLHAAHRRLGITSDFSGMFSGNFFGYKTCFLKNNNTYYSFHIKIN